MGELVDPSSTNQNVRQNGKKSNRIDDRPAKKLKIFNFLRDRFRRHRNSSTFSPPKDALSDSNAAAHHDFVNIDPTFHHRTLDGIGIHLETVAPHDYIELNSKPWYWGPLSRREATLILMDKPYGSFLVRDSERDSSRFTLTFRGADEQIFNNRISFENQKYAFLKGEAYDSISDLIDSAVLKSRDGPYCLSRLTEAPISPSIEEENTQIGLDANQSRCITTKSGEKDILSTRAEGVTRIQLENSGEFPNGAKENEISNLETGDALNFESNKARSRNEVRLLFPVSRFSEVHSLSFLCRFSFRHNLTLYNNRKSPLHFPST
ncbi:unnamed protein product [Protopolystoma xenopodis]|uniref:SH2 domain-containing protein n=1 Tax=Protopolystoma xenopodis TaxID=117903 RepID=A0A448WLP0_9PLAT|nr:unnamed protein product [Protopolystoma xenopodis]